MSDIGLRTVLDDENDISQKSISGLTFVIKDYQRGYRWGKGQIEALMNDVYKFKTDNDTLKYCLQPLVVKKAEPISDNNNLSTMLERAFDSSMNCAEDSSYWELIDGQQRLTTVLLILDCCYDQDDKLPYDIIYVNKRKIDEYYIENAKSTIANWFTQFNSLKIKDIKADIRKKLHSFTQFIWYEVGANENSAEVFTKINMGKVPLTNAELFKALLLNHGGDNSPDREIKLAEIAFEWDKIEQSLREDEFWYFISNSDNGVEDTETRIDYLLNLYTRKYAKDFVDLRTDDPLFPFLVVDRLIKDKEKNNKQDGKSVDEIWHRGEDGIVNTHDTLREWFSDKKKYHDIGFLIAVGKDAFQTVNELMSIARGKKKSEVDAVIHDKIKAEFNGVKLGELDYDKGADNCKKIKKVLLYFNLHTMINSKTEIRFSFKKYKCEKWDIEHIHARASERQIMDADAVERKELLNHLQLQLKEIGEDIAAKEVEAFSRGGCGEDNKFIVFYNKICDKYWTFDVNTLGNLALLDAETNRSYGNSSFATKRQIIINRDKGEEFVPVCTKNVFLKMYSGKEGLKNMLHWGANDAQCYLSEIVKSLVEEAQVCQA